MTIILRQELGLLNKFLSTLRSITIQKKVHSAPDYKSPKDFEKYNY